jgi:hypothetical protein
LPSSRLLPTRRGLEAPFGYPEPTSMATLEGK